MEGSFCLGFQMWLNVTTWMMLLEAPRAVGWGKVQGDVLAARSILTTAFWGRA